MSIGQHASTQNRRPVRQHLKLITVDEGEADKPAAAPLVEEPAPRLRTRELQDAADIAATAVSERSGGNWFARLMAPLVRRWAEGRRRRELDCVVKNLSELSDHSLRDIGLERWEISRRILNSREECGSPFLHRRSGTVPLDD
jgi:uncharacterized protein YjiS (DUF1127 family)